jgi:glucose/arabinose dehydrogenase
MSGGGDPYMALASGASPDRGRRSALDVLARQTIRERNTAGIPTGVTRIVARADSPSVLLVLFQHGLIKQYDLSSRRWLADALDIRDRVASLAPLPGGAGGFADERGLLGAAHSPAAPDKLYVAYSAPSLQSAHALHISQFSLDKQHGDATAEVVLLQLEQPEPNHNGGELLFDPREPDTLYVFTGDGGGAGDRHGALGNAQNYDSWLGKVLRIKLAHANGRWRPHPDNQYPERSYTQPGEVSRERKALFAWGLRNPWSASFAPAPPTTNSAGIRAGALLVNDVGQDALEQVRLVENGDNHGWRAMEGSAVFDARLLETVQSERNEFVVPPLLEYPHAQSGDSASTPSGVALVGGRLLVPDGSAAPLRYVLLDYSGKIMLADLAPQSAEQRLRVFAELPDASERAHTLASVHGGDWLIVGAYNPTSRTSTLYTLNL